MASYPQNKLIIGGRQYGWQAAKAGMSAEDIARQAFANNAYKPEGDNLKKYVSWIEQTKDAQGNYKMPTFEKEAASMPQVQKEMEERQRRMSANQAVNMVGNIQEQAKALGITPNTTPGDGEYSFASEQYQMPTYQQNQPAESQYQGPMQEPGVQDPGNISFAARPEAMTMQQQSQPRQLQQQVQQGLQQIQEQNPVSLGLNMIKGAVSPTSILSGAFSNQFLSEANRGKQEPPKAPPPKFNAFGIDEKKFKDAYGANPVNWMFNYYGVNPQNQR